MENLLNKKGTYIIAFAWLVTMVLWFFTSDNPMAQYADKPIYTTAKLFALSAVTLLSFQYLLATRANFLEKIFGGLDNVYAVHHKLGMLSFFLMIMHPIGIYLSGIVTDLGSAGIYVFPSPELSYNFGILAFYGYLVLMIATLFIKLPYRIWRWTHIFMGIPYVLVGVHVLLLPSAADTSYSIPLRLWILSLISFGIFCALYKRFFYWYLAKQYEYKVTQIQAMSGVTEIYLQATAAKAKFKPGQFIFVKFPNNKLIGNELHPFSLSSNPDLEFVRLSIKSEGKFTKSLTSLKVNETALLYGPYGTFSEKYLVTKKDLVWIAGGIGVTPFLSMMGYESLHNSGRQINFYYTTSTKDEAVYDAEIMRFKTQLPNMRYRNHISKQSGHLTLEAIKADLNGDFSGKVFFLCGPRSMMLAFERALRKAGVTNYNIVYEDFSIFSD